MGNKSLYHIKILKNTLLNRQKGDPKFSLRKFAHLLNVSPTTLSHILNQKKGISESLAVSILEKLSLSNSEKEDFLLSVKSAHSRNSKVKLESTLEIAARKKKSLKRETSVNRNEILIETENFLLETLEVQELVLRTQVHCVYKYFSRASDLQFRLLYILKDRFTGKVVKDFIQVTFKESTKQAATVYFIKKPNGRFKTYFNNVFDGTDRVTGLVPENQNTKIKFDKHHLPTIPLIRFLVLGENKHVIGKMKYTQSEFLIEGKLIELDRDQNIPDQKYVLRLYRK